MIFYENSNLYPYDINRTDLQMFEQLFVKSLGSPTKCKLLFNNYLQYITDFQRQITSSFYQWIDGSKTLKGTERELFKLILLDIVFII